MQRKQRIAFTMKLYPKKEAEYKKRHDEIWPEMVETLKKGGVSNFSIFLQGTTLFAYVEVEDVKRWTAIAQDEVNQRWWVYMKPLMETNPDNSPISHELYEVFHLD